MTAFSRDPAACDWIVSDESTPGAIYYAIWIAVLISALLTMNLLDSPHRPRHPVRCGAGTSQPKRSACRPRA